MFGVACPTCCSALPTRYPSSSGAKQSSHYSKVMRFDDRKRKQPLVCIGSSFWEKAPARRVRTPQVQLATWFLPKSLILMHGMPMPGRIEKTFLLGIFWFCLFVSPGEQEPHAVIVQIRDTRKPKRGYRDQKIPAGRRPPILTSSKLISFQQANFIRCFHLSGVL